jgi:hypothetical protein
VGWLAGAAGTFVSNLMHRDQPLFDPTLYSLRSVSCNLDFNGDKLRLLAGTCGEAFVAREAGLAQLRLEKPSAD